MQVCSSFLPTAWQEITEIGCGDLHYFKDNKPVLVLCFMWLIMVNAWCKVHHA